MSYILEALKKAQAERQVGELPTIHAPTLHGGHDLGAAPAWRTPLLITLGLVLLGAVCGWLWKGVGSAPAMPAASMAAAATAATVAPIVEPAVAPTVAPMPQAPALASTSAPALATTPVAQPMPSAAQTAAAPVAAMAPLPVMQPAPVVAPPQPAPARPARQPADAAPSSDDGVLLVRDLPEPIQRQIPAVSMGGYMYSKNPADRLVLIDKVLRHEGEEISPGIVLEKLQAKSAVFSFKGYRYRVPY